MLYATQNVLDIANVTDLGELHEADFEMEARLRGPTQFAFELEQRVEESDQVLFRKSIGTRCKGPLFLDAATIFSSRPSFSINRSLMRPINSRTYC